MFVACTILENDKMILIFNLLHGKIYIFFEMNINIAFIGKFLVIVSLYFILLFIENKS